MKRYFVKMIFWIIGIIVFLLLVSALIGWMVSAPVYQGEKSTHFDGNKFINPEGIKAKGLSDVLKWMVNRDRGEWQEVEDAYIGQPPARQLPEDIARFTFINHSTVLIQLKGQNILTDPVWSKRVSPFQWIGPKRVRPAGIKFEDLPPIDLVIISHNHYDHLDEATVKRLNAEHHPVFIVPLGVSGLLKKWSVTNVFELDWEQDKILSSEITITAVPAIHFSGRGSMDRDATLWCGYVMKSGSTKIYYAGDSGYGKIFKEIGNKYGPFDMALIPIGAYQPEWFMSPIHISPKEAVQVHLDVQSKKSIAIHYGTFPLADEGLGDAPKDLEKAVKNNGLNSNDFIILPEGHYIDLAVDL